MDVFFVKHNGQQLQVLSIVDHYLVSSTSYEILKDLTPNTTINIRKKTFGIYDVPEVVFSEVYIISWSISLR